jgi:hypothetical protein
MTTIQHNTINQIWDDFVITIDTIANHANRDIIGGTSIVEIHDVTKEAILIALTNCFNELQMTLEKHTDDIHNI